MAQRDDPQFDQQPRSRQSLWVLVANLLLVVVLPFGVGWIVYKVTKYVYVPDGVRRFESMSEKLQKHATGIQMGAIKPEPDPNRIVRYPLTDELRRGGVTSCIESEGVLWYSLPSHPLDGGTPYLATPRDPTTSIHSYPNRVNGSTYDFHHLEGKWAYWFRM